MSRASTKVYLRDSVNEKFVYNAKIKNGLPMLGDNPVFAKSFSNRLVAESFIQQCTIPLEVYTFPTITINYTTLQK